jgi:hypothetical protein
MAPKKSCKGGACKRKTPAKRPSTARKPATKKTATPKRPSSATRKVITQLHFYTTILYESK